MSQARATTPHIHSRPLLRRLDSAPPLARFGATTYRFHAGGNRGATMASEGEPQKEKSALATFAQGLTCACAAPVLAFCGLKDTAAQLAWREKVALCFLFLIAMLGLAFVTLGLPFLFCSSRILQPIPPIFTLSQADHRTTSFQDSVRIYGYYYNFTQVQLRLADFGGISLTSDWLDSDITALFKPSSDACADINSQQQYNCILPNLKFPRSPALGPQPGQPCPDFTWISTLKPIGIASYSYLDLSMNGITSLNSPHTLLLYNSAILNLTSILLANSPPPILQNPKILELINASLGIDGTLAFSSSPDAITAIKCLRQTYTVGYIHTESIGCTITHAIQVFCLMVIIGIVAVKVAMAVAFQLISAFSDIGGTDSLHNRKSRNRSIPQPVDPEQTLHNGLDLETAQNNDTATPPAQSDPYVILFVTCYSEGRESIKSTLESLSKTEYPNNKKLLFVVADGLVTGAGNIESTPDSILALMSFPNTGPPENYNPPLQSYLAIAHGEKQHNMAQVYAGYYINDPAEPSVAVPMIAVIKCGTPMEQAQQGQTKSGNRGKRDSQLILMNFLSRILFEDRMTALDFDLWVKISGITEGNIPPTAYTLVLMVDADTVAEPSSLRHMVETMKRDDKVMGLCGETQVANPFGSWVTMIQVFEYFMSHHLGKAFESCFGGVTCLPGCFCMYRIKMAKGPGGMWTMPVIANPDIVEEYSENMVDTLHKKNLLLLGEDRFLSTMMLRTFPKRKLVYVPSAICKTVVPDKFKILLSQRRRWINSTVHNLAELVRMRDLCENSPRIETGESVEGNALPVTAFAATRMSCGNLFEQGTVMLKK
ncbi:hypothetical protein HDU79_011995 [Rhizoclosmatium sp. JEL0117]|nr:hypothetical protein HDU79_011995 [Rhizoclosmatium sp. JEL0117]